MFNSSTTAANGGSLLGNLEGDISSLFTSLTTAGQNFINQQINPTPTVNWTPILLIGGAVLVLFLVIK